MIHVLRSCAGFVDIDGQVESHYFPTSFSPSTLLLRDRHNQWRDHWNRARSQLPVSDFYNEATAAKLQVGSRSCITIILSRTDPPRIQGSSPRYFRRLILLPAALPPAPDSTLISPITLLTLTFLTSYQVLSEADLIVSSLAGILVTLQCLLVGARLIILGVCWMLKRINADYSHGTRGWDPLGGRKIVIGQRQDR